MSKLKLALGFDAEAFESRVCILRDLGTTSDSIRRNEGLPKKAGSSRSRFSYHPKYIAESEALMLRERNRGMDEAPVHSLTIEHVYADRIARRVLEAGV